MKEHILIVDDDPIFIKLTEVLVKKSNFHSSPKSLLDGCFALNYLKEYYISSDVFVVFLDINMPKMNGWEFLNAIESFADPKNTFVFMVSSSVDKKDLTKAEQNHFVRDFLTKPVNLEAFKTVKKMVPCSF